jgi:lysophospholipase L1-like esterase
MTVHASLQRMRSTIILTLCLAVALAGAVLPAVAAGAVPPVPRDPGLAGYPNAMAATGDSITRAFNTGTIPFTDAPANSWSTGSNGAINSHYVRILAVHPAISGHNYNDAVTGAKMIDLNTQVAAVNGQQVDYVTILLGANDACTSSEAAMTPVATYAAQFQTAMATLSGGSPVARIYVSSVPDIYHLWFILKDDASARLAWSSFSICQSMLANPLSTAQEDVDRRNRVRQRVIDYNTQLATICATYIHCRFDNNTTFNYPFVPADVSTRDYFHPSLTGQTVIAAASYAATFDFTDAVPPVTQAAVMLLMKSGMIVAFSATDNVGVAGIEYRINTGPYTRYSLPVDVPGGSTITYRAVDVNGNVEASQSMTSP